MTRLILRAFLGMTIVLVSQTSWDTLAFANSKNSTDRVGADMADEKSTLADLDEQYQAAVKHNDEKAMDRILAENFVLVTGSGKSYSKQDLLKEARSGQYVYEHQEDTNRSVRIWGDTVVVTAKLWEKGTNAGRLFDSIVWFSDVYVRTPNGWHYVFGQSSLPLPEDRR